VGAGQRAFEDLDAVTVDAFGTLVRLIDPIEEIDRALRERGIERTPDQIRTAFDAEAAFYSQHTVRGSDAETLKAFREESTGVFLEAVGAAHDPAEFMPAYVGALRFVLIPGVVETLGRLRALGLELAVVANWEISVHKWLERLGLSPFFRVIVSSADVGAMKPDPTMFRVVLERLGVPPQRALHVGDDVADEEGARAAGMRFAWAPLSNLR
jgi:HAD superfamily hydrolase (TIGR01509 family)